MPYQEFRKLFENQKPLSRWDNIRFGSSIKWSVAGVLIVVARLLVR